MKNRTVSSPGDDNADTLETLKWQLIDGNRFECTRGLMRMFWDIASTVAASPRKLRVLRALNPGELDQRTISRLAQLERANAQRALAELCKAGLVVCLTPERPRAKIYGITTLGKEVHDRLHDMNVRDRT
ncbi:MAG: MarR family transcriptional regulator [Planctomycetota bacterium]|nr:MarR family transcriptional regulator [Planctomycetota bacterium]